MSLSLKWTVYNCQIIGSFPCRLMKLWFTPYSPKSSRHSTVACLSLIQLLSLVFLSTWHVWRGCPKRRGQEAAAEHGFNPGLPAWASSGAAGPCRVVGCWSKQAGDGVADSAVEWRWNQAAVSLDPWQVLHPSFWPLSLGPCSCFLLWQKHAVRAGAAYCRGHVEPFKSQADCIWLQLKTQEALGKGVPLCPLLASLSDLVLARGHGGWWKSPHSQLSRAVTEKHWISIFFGLVLIWILILFPSTNPLSSARCPWGAKHGSSVLVF